MNRFLAQNLDRVVLYLMGKRIGKAGFNPDIPTHLPSIDKNGGPPSDLHPNQNLSCRPDFSPAFKRRKISVSDFTFTTPLPSPEPANNLVRGRFYGDRRDHQKPVVIFLHGWMMEYYLIYETICLTLAERGLNSIFFELPYHRRRTPEGSFSGQYFLLRDLDTTYLALKQSLAEIAGLIGWLRKEAPKRTVGIVGMSLGGWIGGLLTTIEPRLDFAVLAAPAVDPRVMLSDSPLGKNISPHLTRPEDRQSFQQCCGLTTPSLFSPAIPSEAILLTENVFDCFIPPAIISRLQTRWFGSKRARYRHGHISILYSKKFKNDIADFIIRRCQL